MMQVRVNNDDVSKLELNDLDLLQEQMRLNINVDILVELVKHVFIILQFDWQ